MVYSGLLVGGAIIILNNMKVNGKDYPIYEMENTNHPTRYFNQHKQWQMGTEPWTTAISGDWMATIYGVLAGVFSGENLMISLISWPILGCNKFQISPLGQ